MCSLPSTPVGSRRCLRSSRHSVVFWLFLVLSIASAGHVEAADTWFGTGSMSVGRHSHTAVLLEDGRVLVIGGYNGSPMASVEIYDPVLGTWSITSSMGAARSSHTSTLLPDGRVFVSGGSGLASAEIYNPGSGIHDPL